MGAITYELLFDLLRRERNRDDLQKLDATFYTDVLSYMAQKQASISPTAMSAESEKARIQFHNIKKILRELYDRREKKIVSLALNHVRTGVSMADASSFLPEEQLLFSELKTNFSKYRQEILDSVLHGRAPFSGNIPFSFETESRRLAERELVTNEDAKEEEEEPADQPLSVSPSFTDSQEVVSEPQFSVPLSSSSSSSVALSSVSSSSSVPQSSVSLSSSSSSRPIKISFIKAVPRFAGSDEQVFGPFSPGDEATLPNKIASVLVRKGRAEEI